MLHATNYICFHVASRLQAAPFARKLVDLEFMRPGEADFLEELTSGQRILVLLHTAAQCTLHGLRQKQVAPGLSKRYDLLLTTYCSTGSMNISL